MPLSDSKILFWNGKHPLKSVHLDVIHDKDRSEQPSSSPVSAPSLCGVPLKYISYVFPIRRHHSRTGYSLKPFSIFSIIVHRAHLRILTLFFPVLLL